MATQNPVPKVYRTVVEDVVNNVREAFLDEGLDEQVLQELKQLWESKLLQSKAVESIPPEHEQFISAQPPFTTLPQQAAAAPPAAQPQSQPQNVQQVLTQPVSTAYKTQNIEIPQSAVMPTVFAPVGGAIDLSNAAQTATLALPAGLISQQIALNPGAITLQQTSQGHIIAVPNPAQTTQVAGSHQQQQQTHVTYTLAPTQINQGQQPTQPVIQIDGANDTSSEDEDYEDDDDDKDDEDDDDDAQKDENAEGQGEEEDPLNSGDDVSEEDPAEIFDTENVVVCQYDKINRNKNRWKFHLKDGIMNLNGRDYVFQKANGDAEW